MIVKTLHRPVILTPSLTICIFITLAILIFTAQGFGDIANRDSWNSPDLRSNYINIRNPNGKLYAYIVLLFNENPHFVNIIQEYAIPMQKMQKEGFHIGEYTNYLRKIKDPVIYRLAKTMLKVYLYPEKFNNRILTSLQAQLGRRNIVVRFSRDRNYRREKVVLDYCIFGTKRKLTSSHPLFSTNEKIYNIIPYLYYDEFSTSNSTFYFDMIYINPEEVQNDYIIAKKVLRGENVESMFFVGARVTDDIKYCLQRAFKNRSSIKSEIWKLFEIHELTHKILNNSFNYFDQVTGEELALSSTIYFNVYLGLSVLYSYLDYNTTNPHRIAAMNYLRYIAQETGKKNLIDNPSIMKTISISEIQRLTKSHFNTVLKNMKS